MSDQYMVGDFHVNFSLIQKNLCLFISLKLNFLSSYKRIPNFLKVTLPILLKLTFVNFFSILLSIL